MRTTVPLTTLCLSVTAPPQWPKVLNSPLSEVDPELHDIIEKEKNRQYKVGVRGQVEARGSVYVVCVCLLCICLHSECFFFVSACTVSVFALAISSSGAESLCVSAKLSHSLTPRVLS
jgi:hypothetical protein